MTTLNRKRIVWAPTLVMVLLVVPYLHAEEAGPGPEPTPKVAETPQATAGPTQEATEPATKAVETGGEMVEVVVEQPPEETTETSAEQSVESVEPKEEEKGFKHHLPIIYYGMALAVGSSRDYISDYSFRGISFEYRYRIIPQFSVGGVIGWNILDEKVKGTFNRDNVTVTGTQLRWLDVLTLAATMHYNLDIWRPVLPFLGLELGAYYTSRYVDLGWWTATEDGWHFGLAPEIGTLVHAGSVSFAFSVKFKYLVETDDAPEELFMGFNVGIGFLR